ncbi:MAG: amidase, partial [Chloroflexi bacterium]|nr:amidase [Chloroflexota bacterium]
ATPPVLQQVVRRGFRLGLGRVLPLAADTFYAHARRNLLRTPFTQLANLTGVPAMSVPLHQSRADLPIGVQFVAGLGGEGLLLALGGELERAAPWADRVAPT